MYNAQAFHRYFRGSDGKQDGAGIVDAGSVSKSIRFGMLFRMCHLREWRLKRHDRRVSPVRREILRSAQNDTLKIVF